MQESLLEEPGAKPALDQEGVACLMMEQRRALTFYAQSIVRDIHMAEDVFQDVCVKAIKHHRTFKDSLHLTKWTRRVARNRSIDCLRQKESQNVLLREGALELQETHGPEECKDLTFKKIEVLRGCMGRMTPYSREIIRLRYTEELPGIQVASILNRKVDTIYKALTRIHATLRSCMKSRLNSATF
tara:strand:+ start:1136 stop:1693 length:558 start_codon:yes stop_codon:yes gene_type:complete